MEEKFERDALERELKRVRRGIEACSLVVNTTTLVIDEEDASAALVNELLLLPPLPAQSPANQFDLPLPLPIQLESKQRAVQLVEICEQIFSGLRLNSAKRVGDRTKDKTWELSGEAGVVEFAIEFQTNAGIMTKFELTRFPAQCQQEVKDLALLAQHRSCLRTWLVGVSEYSVLVGERIRVFHEIRTLAPLGIVRDSTNEQEIETGLDLYSRDGMRGMRIVWTCNWTAIPTSPHEPNEFLVPELTLNVLQGFTEPQQRELVEDPEALSGLIRSKGIEQTILALIQSLLL